MIEDSSGSVIREFERTFELLMLRSRPMKMDDIRTFVGLLVSINRRIYSRSSEIVA